MSTNDRTIGSSAFHRTLRARKFGIATLFVLTTAAAIAIHQTILPLQKEQQIVELVQRLGGDVRFRPASGLSALLRRFLAIDVPGTIDFVNLRMQPVTDDELSRILESPTLRLLDVSGSLVTDKGVKQLGTQNQLESLGLSGTQITDASVQQLASLKRLKFLDLSSTRVTGGGIQTLGGLKQLRTLRLESTRTSDECLALIATLPNLWQLDLKDTRVTDHGLAALSRCKNLRSLDVSRSFDASLPSVSDVGAKLISRIKTLVYLDLSEQDLTDAGLEHLASMPKLEQLYLGHSKPKFSAKGLEQFTRATVTLYP